MPVPLSKIATKTDLRPTPSGVSYCGPNPDKSRKMCGNCVLWVAESDPDGRCVVHSNKLKVLTDQVCGYHVYGKPLEEWIQFSKIEPLDPKLSGLAKIPGGTSCDLCKFFRMENSKGRCGAVQVDGKDAEVEAKGCCARWEAK